MAQPRGIERDEAYAKSDNDWSLGEKNDKLLDFTFLSMVIFAFKASGAGLTDIEPLGKRAAVPL